MEGENNITPLSGANTPAVVDPNKARAESDKVEKAVKKVTKEAKIKAKTLVEDTHKEAAIEAVKAAVAADVQYETSADERFANMESDIALIKSLMNDLGVDELHENSNSEYFTSLNLAILSEGGKASRVKTHNKEDI